MKNKITLSFCLLLFCSVFVFSQSKVILINGETKPYSELVDQADSILLKSGTDNTSIAKSDVLAVVPGKKKSITYHHETKKKLVISKKDVQHDYQKSDIPKIMAYKFYKTEITGEEAYNYNPSDNITKEEFILVFDEMQGTIKKRNIIALTVALPLSIIALAVGLSSLMSTMKDVQSLSMEINPALKSEGSRHIHFTLNIDRHPPDIVLTRLKRA